MFKRRMEITRERWTSFSFRGHTALSCKSCGLVPELVRVDDAAARLGLPLADIDRAIASGILGCWNAGEHRLVCLRCTKSHWEKNRNA